MAVRGEEDAARCLGGVRGRPRCWVRRLGRGHCEGGQRAAPGRWRPGPGDRRGPRVAGYRPERHRPGVVARPAAWYHRSCPECDESCQRQRGRQGAAVEPDHRSTHRPTHVTDQSVQAPRRWLKRAGSPHPVQRENGAIRRGVRPPARPATPSRLPPAPAPRRRDRRPGSRPRDWWRSARGPGRPGPNTSKVPPSGSGKAAKSASCWLVVRPRTAWRNAPRAGYSLVLVPTQPMHLTRILVAPRSGAWRPRSCHVAAGCPGV
jgi:hypothetical protein